MRSNKASGVDAGTEMAPLTVLYVTGWGRSGTTLLGNILNEVQGCFNAGELWSLWSGHRAGPQGGATCGCGLVHRACPVWSCVLRGEIAPGVTLEAGMPAMVASLRTRFRTRHTWRLLKPPRDEAAAADLRVLTAAYRAIQAVTGARVVVDTSKVPSGAAALLHLHGITPAVVQMVRDPRAVAYSWQRPKGHLDRRGAASSTWHWLRFNLAAEAVRGGLPASSLLLRYEDLVADPEVAVGRVLELVGVPADRSPLRDARVVLGGNHTADGNPDRFAIGEVGIRDDGRWRAGLSTGLAFGVTALALPMLRRYGYRVARPRRAPPEMEPLASAPAD